MNFLFYLTRNSVVEGTKAHYRVKHAKFEFANRRSHINEIENFFASSYSFCNCVVEGAM
ncbi:hypothetical protein [Campylobacter troglodytis]|uniref:hypothetical protein n=1 Tax=Campylobacter troglodytis TaxID=654363 RepID=UPI00163BCB1E|nr:hypothetical protein [Campylobacter troglodytis]